MENVNKISIKEALKEAFGLYKNNFKLLFGVSTIGFLIDLIYTTADYLTNYLKNPGTLGFVAGLIFFFIIAIPNIYFGSIITITLIKSIYNISNNYKTTLKEVYAFAKLRFWTYFGTSIGIGVILGIPLIAEICISNFCKQSLIKYISMIILLIPTIYLMIRYYFATILAAIDLEEDDKGYFETSKILIKGRFFKVLMIAVITQLLFWIPLVYIMLVPTSLKMVPSHKYMYDIARSIIDTIYNPFSQAVNIIILNQLISSKIITKKVIDETNLTD